MTGIRIRLTAAVGAVVATLSLTSLAASAAPEPRAVTTMGQHRAAAYYLRGACKSTAADKAYYRGIYRGAHTIYLPEINRRLREIERFARADAQGNYAWAKSLLHPPSAWPSNVADYVHALAERVITKSDDRRAESYAENGRQWIRLATRSDNVSFKDYPAQIRANLGLPPPGKGC